MKFLFGLLLIVGVLSVCPNNCSGHGKCGSDGVCKCYKKSDGSDNDYIGGCGSGKSFSGVNSNEKYAYRRVDDGNLIYRSLLGDDEKMDLSAMYFIEITSKITTKASGVYKVTTNGKIAYNSNEEASAGKLNCYNSENEFVSSIDIIKVIDNSNNYYMKDENNKIDVGMKCLLVVKYSDLSLINPTEVDENNKVIWKGMSEIFPEIKAETPSYKMGCTTQFGEAVSEVAISEIIINKENGDIEFTLPAGTTGICVLLAKIDSDSGVVSVTDAGSDYTKYTTALTESGKKAISNMYGIKDKNIYTVKKDDSIIKYSDKSFGLLNCRIPGNGDIQTAYLFGEKDTNYYILYDFDFVNINGESSVNPISSLYYCELSQYDDFSLYHPVKAPSECQDAANCKITWNNMCDAFTSYLPSGSTADVQFACRDENSNGVELYDYEIPTSPCTGDGDVEFTMKTDASKFPTGRICNIIAGKDNSVKAISIDISESVYYKNYLTKKSSTKVDKYYSSLPTSTKIPKDSKIYKVNGLNIISLPSGGIMRCYKYEDGKITHHIDNVNLLYKNGNDYYVHTETDIKGSDCELLYSHKDMTLYPSEISGKTVAFTGMSYYFQLLGFFKSHEKDKKYTMLCGTEPTAATDSQSFNEYRFTLTSELKLPYYESTSGDVVFTVKPEGSLTNGNKCFLLSSFDGNKIDVDKSDLKNKYEIENKGGLKLKLKPPIVTTTVVANTDEVYSVTGVKYDGIAAAGGLLECRNKNNNRPLGLAKIYSHYEGENNVDTYLIKYYFVKSSDTNKPTPEYYNCEVIESYNDLTLYLPPQTCEGSGSNECVVTWKGITIDALNGKGITIPTSENAVKMLCETAEDDNYKLYDAKAADASGNSITFTISVVDGLPSDKKCFVMLNTKGDKIETFDSIKNSDLGKIYEIKPGKTNVYTLNLKSPIPTATEKETNTGIYELLNVKYDIGSELSCIDYSNNDISTGLILKKESEKYLMSFEKEKDLNVLKCMIINKYNDLSNYVKCTMSGTDCPTKITGNALSTVGFITAAYTLHCSKDGGLTEYTSESITIPSSGSTAITITFSSGPSDKATCHLLYSFEGKEITVEKSDVKSTNFLSITTNDKYTYYESKPNINTKPQPVEDEKIDIIGEVGIIGANLQCRDKKSNKFLGLAVLLGKDEDDKNIMKYLFDIPRDSDSFICEVNEIINDLSLIKSEVVDDGACFDNGDCMIIISGILNIIKSNIFKNNENERILAELSNGEYEVSCVDKSENNKVINYIVEAAEEMSVGDDAVFVIIPEKNENKKLPIGMECRLLMNSNGERIELEQSQFGKTLYLTSDNEFSTSPCTPDDAESVCNAEDDESTIFIKGDLSNRIKTEYGKSKRLFIPIINKENRTIIENYLQPGKWIEVGGIIAQIISIDYTLVEGPTESPLPRRQLRELASGGVEGYYVILDKVISSFPNEFTILLNADNINKYEPHISLECSGQGICNRESGLCECFSGYSGDSCQRLDCPNNCNGNGRCVSLSELLNNEEIMNNYQGFGNKRNTGNIILDDEVYGCLCDKRYRGYDCSLIECPSDKDPSEATNMPNTDDEKRDCSGRGICDYKTGICECFDGFSGEGCQNQVATM